MNKLPTTPTEALDLLQKMNIAFSQQNLITYAWTGDAYKTELLLIAGANPNEYFLAEKNQHYYPLHNTACNNQKAIIDLLIKYGVNLNLLNEVGETAIMFAMRHNHLDMVEYLIDKGADLTIKNRDGVNALFLAKRLKKQDFVDLLKRKGAVEPTAEEIQTVKKQDRKNSIILFGIIGVAILVIGYFANGYKGSSPSSGGSSPSSSSSSAEHKCGYCSKTFTGNGWSSAIGEQYEQSTWTGYGYCSKKCAYDAQPAKWKK